MLQTAYGLIQGFVMCLLMIGLLSKIAFQPKLMLFQGTLSGELHLFLRKKMTHGCVLLLCHTYATLTA
jgi:hypothetical protein